MFASKAGAYPIAKLSRCSTLLALPINMKLGWKDLQETNTLAFYEHPKITNIKVLKHWPLVVV